MSDYAGIYGLGLECFPELFQPITYGTMTPLINDGYTDGTAGQDAFTIIGTYSGFLLNAGGKSKDSNGNLVSTDIWHLYVSETLLLGNFVEVGGNRYRIVPSQKWSDYLGFNHYEIELLVGSDGSVPVSSGFSNGASDVT
jgi:hypothetical protein